VELRVKVCLINLCTRKLGLVAAKERKRKRKFFFWPPCLSTIHIFVKLTYIFPGRGGVEAKNDVLIFHRWFLDQFRMYVYSLYRDCPDGKSSLSTWFFCVTLKKKSFGARHQQFAWACKVYTPRCGSVTYWLCFGVSWWWDVYPSKWKIWDRIRATSDHLQRQSQVADR